MSTRTREAMWWLAAILGYLVLAWLLAPQLLAGPLTGNDFPNAFALAKWISRTFPAMPFWFPYQGTGVSPSAGYAIAPLYATAFLHRAVGMDLIAAGRLLVFLAMPFGALGVAGLARALGLGRGAAFAAGAFSLLPPAAWNLLVHVGLFSNAFAAAFAPWAAAGMVAYARLPGRALDRRGVALLVGSALAAAAAFVSHPAVSVVPLALGGVAALGGGWRAIARSGAVAVAALLVASGALVSFVEYSRAAESSALFQVEDLRRQFIPVAVLVGLAERHPTASTLHGMSLTPFLLVLALLGAPVAVRRRPLVPLLLATLAAVAYLFSGELQVALVQLLPAALAPALGNRGWFVFAIVGLAVLAALALERVAGHLRRPFAAATTVLAAALALVLLEGAGYGPHAPGDPPFLRGRLPLLLTGGDPEVALRLDPKLGYKLEDTAPVAARLGAVPGRADLSAHSGDLLGLSLLGDARVVQLYTVQLSLIHPAWSDQRAALYEPNELGVLGPTVDETAAWFGVSRVALLPTDDAERFRRAGWTLARDERFVYADAPATRTLAAFRERGVVLHVGRAEAQTYRTTFRLAAAGGLPFATAWLVRGPTCIDDVPLEELARFDAVVLDGHCERDREASLRKIAAYVERGGRLFLETGWEGSPYHAVDPAPSFAPADALRWGPIGVAPKLALGSAATQLADVDALGFGDFRYGAGTWDVSSAATDRLRLWARPVLTAEGRALVAAGEVGAGRVVWSGMNLVTHLAAKQSVAERALYARLMSWLLEGATTPPGELSVAAQTEDGGSLSVRDAGWVLWREPAPFAEISPPSPRYVAGPGFLLIRVGAGTYRVEQHPSPRMRLFAALGAVSTVALLLWGLVGIARGGAPGVAPILALAASARAAWRERVVAPRTAEEDDP